MTTDRFFLTKHERLSWKRHIDMLFTEGQSFIAFPLRVVYLLTEEEMPVTASMLVSVSKKKFKRAVKRNLIKRQVREAYRLNKQALPSTLAGSGKNLLMAFLYVDKEIHPHTTMDKAMKKAMLKLNERIQ